MFGRDVSLSTIVSHYDLFASVHHLRLRVLVMRWLVVLGI
jgi:hypothetical protein